MPATARQESGTQTPATLIKDMVTQTPPTTRRRDAATITTAKNLVVNRELLQEALDASIELYRHQCELDARVHV